MSADLLTAGELMARLGMSSSAFYRHRKQGAFRHLLVSRPVGMRKYSRVLVDQWLSGDGVRLLRRTA